MDRDMVIDLLHAIRCQYDSNTVNLDGETYCIDEVCTEAIGLIEDSERADG